MSKRINMNVGASANGGPGIGLMTAAGNPWTLADGLADEFVNRQIATYTDQQPVGGGVFVAASDEGWLIGPKVYMPQPVASRQANYNNLMDVISRTDANAQIIFPFGKTYQLSREIVPLTGQMLYFNQSKLKLPDQVYSTLTAGVTVSSAVANPIVDFPVASNAGYFVGQRVALEDQTVGGQRTYTITLGIVTAIASGLVTVQFVADIAAQIICTVNSATFAESKVTNYTFPPGSYLCSINRLLRTEVTHSRVGIFDLEIDGNRANNTLGNRWEISACLDIRHDRGQVRGLYIHDAPTDGMYFAATRTDVDKLWINKTGAMCIHAGAAAATGAQVSNLSNLWLDSAGLGTPMQGHYGGSSTHPSYACLGFSRITDHLIITKAQITNDLGVTGSTYGGGIGCITGSDNFAIEFSDINISGFNKGVGAIQLLRSGANAAPSRVDFNLLHVENCGPITLGAANIWEVCSLGWNSGLTPQGEQIRIRNSDFTDSPLMTYDVNAALETVVFTTTAIGNSSSLALMGSGPANGRVELSNVRSVRPITTAGNVGAAPGASEYANNIHANNTTVRGNDVRALFGGHGLRAQSGADVEISNFRGEDNYYYGAWGASASTRLVLDGPRVRLRPGFTANASWAGISFQSGGGSLGAGAVGCVTNPDIEAVTTNAAQTGISLNSTAGVINTVSGGKIKVSGTSTTPVTSGGASGIGIVNGVLLSHAFAPGASETGSNNVVSANG
nr:hypothetical protein [uncultured Roseateles sp.]